MKTYNNEIAQVYISIVLDKRRAKKNGKYPVKLRVFTPEPKKQKLYQTVHEYTAEVFDILRPKKNEDLSKEEKKQRSKIIKELGKRDIEAQKIKLSATEVHAN